MKDHWFKELLRKKNAKPQGEGEAGEIRVYLSKREIISETDRVEGFTILGRTYLFYCPEL